VSVLLENPAGEEEAEGVRKPLVQVLEDGGALDIRYMESGKKAVPLIFSPLHLICSLGFNLVFGMARSGEEGPDMREGRYRLLYLDRIREASLRPEQTKAPAYVYVQTTGSRDIEVVLARESSDLLLVFALPPGEPVKNPPSEYRLLVQTEIFAQR
jgi:hypothetical protein